VIDMAGFWSSPAIVHAVRAGELGTVIRLARKAHGLTQADLGAACGYSQSVVSRIERGQRHAYDVRFLHRIAGVLGVPPQFLGLAERAAERPASSANHRDLFTATGVATASVLLPPLPHVTDPTADALRLVTAAQRRLDARMPSRDLAESVRSHLRLTVRALRAAPDAGTRAELAAALSEITVLAGWLHWDMYDLGSARRHFDMAISSARESGDRLLAAYTTGYLAAFSTHHGDGDQSLGLVASARQQLGADRPAIADAWLGGIAAQGHAAAGDERSTLAALDHAVAAAERVPAQEPPPWPWVSTVDTTWPSAPPRRPDRS
jgi:transcriptional regulator with XRE-family HTH domain